MIKGFSFIELLIVLMIISILSTLAYPSYHEYIVRAHRMNARLALLDLACRMEGYFGQHHTYKTATIGNGKLTDVLSTSLSPEGWYTLSFTELTNTTYTLKATPIKMQDPICGSLTLSSLGIKGISTASTSRITQCW